MFSTVKKKNLFLVSIHFSVYIHFLKLSWQVKILFHTLETIWTIYDLYAGQIKRRKMRLLRTMAFLKSLLNISGSRKPEFTKQCALLPTVLQIHDDCRFVWEKLTVLESSPLRQCAGRKGPWGLPTGGACIPRDCVLWAPHHCHSHEAEFLHNLSIRHRLSTPMCKIKIW